MPPKKLKKPPKNSFYFYMVARKKELELQGYRFPGGMKEVASTVAGEWAKLSAVEKLPFEEESKRAKEEGKSDMSNKYTVTGESYAQMQRRIMEERQAAEDMENYISELGTDEGALDRYFILIKTIHCVEQILERNNRVYWPLELALCAFSLREGLKSIHWTLVDTVRTPVGYASAAKETSEETGLPEPGSKMMTEEFRDYFKIMKNTKGFIEYWTKKGYRKGPVVFAMDLEIDHIRGCLQWMVERLDSTEDVHRDYDLFVANLKIFKLPKLIIRLAEHAHQVNPAYENVLTTYKLENQAATLVSKGCYDYRDEITCHFHRREDASLKMYTCCRNIVLKRMYLMFEEFLPAFGLDKLDRHDINQLGKAAAARAKSVVAKAVAASHPEPPKSSFSKPSSNESNWSRRKPDIEDDEEETPPNRPSKPTSWSRKKTLLDDDDDDEESDILKPSHSDISESFTRRKPADAALDDENSSSSYSRRKPPDDDDNSNSSYSRRKPADDDDNSNSSYSRRKPADDDDYHRSSHSRGSSSYSRRKPEDEDVGCGSKSGRSTGSGSYSRRRDDDRRDDEYNRSGRTSSSSSSHYSKSVKKDRDDVSRDYSSSRDRRHYKRRHEDDSDGNSSDDSRRHRSKSRHHHSKSSSRDRDRDSDDYRSSSRSSSKSKSTFLAAAPVVDPEGFVPWGNKRDTPTAVFDEEDFPALGALPTPTLSFGRGAGRGLIKQEKDDNFTVGNGKYDY